MDVRPQNNTITGRIPLDRPGNSRAHRIYVAMTNNCNRACPWCSTCSSPNGSTFMKLTDFVSVFPKKGLFEVQLEGGEPTVHPAFWSFVETARAHERCTQLILVTNGVRLPRDKNRLAPWLKRLGMPLTLKISINHYLLGRDPGLLGLAILLKEEMNEGQQLVLNVRLRRGFDEEILEAVKTADLDEVANVFYLQRYGFASDEKDWEEPFVVGVNFSLINPDGTIIGTDLIERSEAMRKLP